MNWLKRFMAGRYGMDQLSLTMIVFSLALSILSKFISLSILYIVSLVTLVFAYIRIFSRKLGLRYAENNRFLNLIKPLTNFLRLSYRRIRDYKDYRYYRCKECRQMIRVPRGKGRLEITCPRCDIKIIKRT